jgi:geranylgeranyl transferase type-1 subunit beta
MDKLDQGIINRQELIKWSLSRQITGFQGRPNKLPDVCYGFWIGASLNILDAFDLVNHEKLRDFLLDCQPNMGGFGKDPESYPGKYQCIVYWQSTNKTGIDLLHSYMGVAVLSLMSEPGIEAIDSALNAPLSAYTHLKEKSVFWKRQ